MFSRVAGGKMGRGCLGVLGLQVLGWWLCRRSFGVPCLRWPEFGVVASCQWHPVVTAQVLCKVGCRTSRPALKTGR